MSGVAGDNNIIYRFKREREGEESRRQGGEAEGARVGEGMRTGGGGGDEGDRKDREKKTQRLLMKNCTSSKEPYKKTILLDPDKLQSTNQHMGAKTEKRKRRK